MSHSTPKLIFGTAGINHFEGTQGSEIFEILDKYNVKELDTAYIYENSEAKLKEYDAPSKYTIHTKAPGFKNGALSKESILSGIAESFTRLGVSHVETYFLHAPDPTVPLEETCAAIAQLHKEGKFTHFGLSNFTASQVQEIYDIQSKSGGVLPTVFQGNYNAVSRSIESDLFPVLRKLKIAFYAYSPIAGGFLVKDPKQLRAGTATGRLAKDAPFGAMYNKMYSKESLISGLEEWGEIAEEEGISKAALAYRWTAFHSALEAEAGDAIIIGATKPAQLEESLNAIKQGPLGAKTVEKIDDVWEKVKNEAPLDNYHSFAKEHMVK